MRLCFGVCTLLATYDQLFVLPTLGTVRDEAHIARARPAGLCPLPTVQSQSNLLSSGLALRAMGGSAKQGYGDTAAGTFAGV
jgi:hypothetical protein